MRSTLHTAQIADALRKRHIHQRWSQVCHWLQHTYTGQKFCWLLPFLLSCNMKDNKAAKKCSFTFYWVLFHFFHNLLWTEENVKETFLDYITDIDLSLIHSDQDTVSFSSDKFDVSPWTVIPTPPKWAHKKNMECQLHGKAKDYEIIYVPAIKGDKYIARHCRVCLKKHQEGKKISECSLWSTSASWMLLYTIPYPQNCWR